MPTRTTGAASPVHLTVFEGGRDIWCFACEDDDCACDPPVTDPEQAAAALRELHEEDETRWEDDGHVSPWDHDESFAAIWSDLLAGLAAAGLPATITTGAIALVEIGTTVGTVHIGGAEGGLPRDRGEHLGWTVRFTTAEGCTTRKSDDPGIDTAVALVLDMLPSRWSPLPNRMRREGCLIGSSPTTRSGSRPSRPSRSAERATADRRRRSHSG